MDITHKRALVSGAASGIGRAVVERLLDEGLEVCALDRRPVEVEDDDLIVCRADVTDPAAVDACYERCVDELGGLEVLVSSAGVGIHERLDEGDPDKWRRVIETNLVGALRLIRAFSALLREGDGVADAVLVTSVADRNAYTYGGPYAASKAGLSAVAETLRLELLPEVRVTNVRPGMVDTAFFEHSIDQSSPTPGQVGWSAISPRQVAEAILFALTRPDNVAISGLTLRPTEQSL